MMLVYPADPRLRLRYAMTAIPVTMRNAVTIRMTMPPSNAPMLTRMPPVPRGTLRRRQPLAHQTERVRPEVIHQDEREDQVGDQAPEEARALVLQVHEVHHPQTGLDQREHEQGGEQSPRRQMLVRQHHLDSHDEDQPHPHDHVDLHARSVT